MLKLALIENLRRLAEELLAARAARNAADAYVSGADEARGIGSLPPGTDPAFIVQLLHRLREYGLRLAAVRAAVDDDLAARQTTAEETIRGEHQRQGVAQASVANAVTSLRLCTTLDWQEYVESVSLVEQVLQRDPSGAYPRMDFLSRDQQRQAVEELATASGEGQVRVALKAIESARQAAAAGSTDARAAHVGYHLVDRGRADLEAELAFRPAVAIRIRRALVRHAAGVYLGAIAAVTALVVATGVAYAGRVGGTAGLQWLAALLVLLPASDFAIALVQRAVVHAVGPRRLPRLDFPAGVPESARTMVIVPTMLTSAEGVDALVEHIEVLALGNLDPCIHFAILSDFADTTTPDAPGDAAILARARAGIEALNVKFGEDHSRSLLPLSPRSSVERRRERVDRVGAEAREDRGVQPPAARRRGHQLLDPGRRAGRAAVGALLHHARLGHAPAARCRPAPDRHHRAPAEPAAVRRPTRAGHRGLRHPAAARQRHDGQRGGIALRAHLRRPHGGRSVYDRGLRRLPGPVRRGHLHRQGPLRRRCLLRGARRPRPGKRAALARPVRGPLRADGARHRRRSRGRLSLQRAGPRAAAASLGARRLADPVVAVSIRPFAARRDAQSPAAHLPLEDPRQSAAQPDASGDAAAARRRMDRPAGTPDRLDGDRAGGGRVPVAAARDRGAAGPSPGTIMGPLPADGRR